MFIRKADGRAIPFQNPALTAREQPTPTLQACGDGTDINAVCLSLTARQRDVLAVLMQGKSNKGICRVLNLAEPTVKNHVTAILKTLGVTNRTEAVIKVSGAAISLLSFASQLSGHQRSGNEQTGQFWAAPVARTLRAARA